MFTVFLTQLWLRTVYCLLSYTALILFVSTPTFAVSDPKNTHLLQEQIVKEEQLRLEQEKLQREQLTPPTPDVSIPADKLSRVTENPETACIIFQIITLEGANLLLAQAQKHLLAPYHNQCLGAAQLIQLQTDITQYYIQKGFITTRVYYPKQDFAHGHLKLWVLEGTIEHIEILEKAAHAEASSSYEPRKGFNTALFAASDTVLNLRDLEQAIDQMNRLQAYDTKMVLEPGKKAGSTDLKFYTQKTKTWHASARLDNSGSKTFGQYQTHYGVVAEDTLGLYERWSFNFSRLLQAHHRDRYSNSFAGSFSLPLGYWTLDLSSSIYKYRLPVQGQVVDYQVSGNSRSHTLGLSRMIHRDQVSKTRLSTRLGHTETRSYIQDIFIEVSSRKHSYWSWSLDHSRRIKNGIYNGELTVQRGMPWWDAKADNSHHPLSPKNRYWLWRLNNSFYQPFTFFNQNFSWYTQLQAQLAPQTLYNSERLTIGGQYSVRGFNRQSLSGDKSAFWRNDFTWQLPAMVSSVSQQLFVGYDIGGVIKDWRDNQEQGWIHGLAAGYRLQHQHFSTQLQWERGLAGPRHAKPEPLVFRLSAALNF